MQKLLASFVMVKPTCGNIDFIPISEIILGWWRDAYHPIELDIVIQSDVQLAIDFVIWSRCKLFS